MPANISLLFWPRFFYSSIAWEIQHTDWQVGGENLQVSCLPMGINISRNFLGKGKRYGTIQTVDFTHQKPYESSTPGQWRVLRIHKTTSTESPTTESSWFQTLCAVCCSRMEILMIEFNWLKTVFESQVTCALGTIKMNSSLCPHSHNNENGHRDWN